MATNPYDAKNYGAYGDQITSYGFNDLTKNRLNQQRARNQLEAEKFQAMYGGMFGGSSGSGTGYSAPPNEYENRLKALMSNPNSISDSGSYKFAFNQGQQALERSAAARGMTGSGNVLAELANYGQGMASQQYGAEADRLASMAHSRNQYDLGKEQNALTGQRNQLAAIQTMFDQQNKAPKVFSGGVWYNS